ncbi:DUF3015 family protein [Marinimicrobium alkaliphilum]|uniref:DUF3015 family protein n=1 Tax=Marinimicrobium alkaliphilum TaxID=2202654 RepID=UPI0018E098AC|nr:DUF3015 family protein [Marinimicrobium alkaliphilum]
MIKRIAITAALISAPMLASADPGCGLGAQVWDGQDGPIAHILAATTNGTSANQTFGMTSGTLGCDTSETISAAALFMNDNIDQVAENMASGEGEALDALASLLGIEATDRAAFQSLAQSEFGSIFAAEDVTAGAAMGNLVVAMSTDTRLAKYVS